MVSRETGWPVRAGPDLARPHYLPWLRAHEMGGRRAENGARKSIFLHLASLWHRPESRLLKGDANACRIQAGEDRERYFAADYRIRFRQNPQRASSRSLPHE